MSSKELSKAYEPKSVEERWYSFWLDKNYFHADAQDPARLFQSLFLRLT